MTDDVTQAQPVATPAATVDAAKDSQKGPDKVEMPPEIQRQFNKIYKEVKSVKERNSFLEAHSVKLTDALVRIQSEGKDTANKNAIDNIKQQIKTARELGDEDAVAAHQEKLTELMVEAKLEKKLPKPEVKAPQKEEGTSYNLGPSEERQIGRWLDEVDDEDEPLRPWARDPKHPKAAAAAEYLADVLADEQYEDLSFKEKLALVDEKFMRKAKVSRDVNAVGAGSLTNNKNQKQDTLNDDQKRVAHRIFSKLSKEEAEKKYMDGLKAAGMK